MQVEVEKRDNVTLVSIRGDALLAGLDELERTLACCADEQANVVVDLGQVHYLSGRAIEVLHQAIQAIRSSGQDLKLVNVDPHVVLLLQASGMASLVQICPDYDAAMASFSRGVGEIERALLSSDPTTGLDV